MDARVRGANQPAKASTRLAALLVLLAACGPDDPAADGPTGDAPGVDTAAPGPLDASVSVDLGPRDATAPDAGDDSADAGVGDVDDAADAGPDGDDPFADRIEIVAVSPEQGSTEGGTELLIIGRRFPRDIEVLLGSEPCLAVDVVDETKLVCTTPPNPAGAYPVKVVTSDDLGVLHDAYRYVAPVRLAAVEPALGPTDGGVPLVLRGQGFSPEAQVSIGGRLVLGLEWVTAGELRGFAPAGEAGPQTVRVSDSAGLFELPEGFTYVTPLRLDALLPGAGPAAGGNLVLVEGAGFAETSALEVRFGLLEAELIESDGDGALVVVAPPGPAGVAVDVTVDAGEQGVRTLVGAYRYLAADAEPGVVAVWPRWGTVDGGDAVVVSGPALDQADAVQFGGGAATLLDSGAGWLRVATPPAGAPGFVDVTATAPAWTSQLDNAFDYRPAVHVDVVEPAEGDVAGGTRVTLRGVGFEPGATVRVGPLAASAVAVADDTELAFTTPPGSVGATTVVVSLPDGREARAEGAFRYTMAPIVHGVDPVRGSLAGGTWGRVRGAGFVAPVTVRFGGVEVPELTLLDPATLAVRTPPWPDETYVDVTVEVGTAEPLVAPERFLYFDSSSPAGGVWGGPIGGSVNVTVVGENGNLLESAYVTLAVRGETEFRGVTDARGQVSLSGPDLSGRQIVSATRPGYGSASFYGVDAENVNLELGCAHDGACLAASDCFDGLVCADGFCLDPPCIGQGGPIPGSERAYLQGQLTGLDKVGDPGPGELQVGAVWTTQPAAFQISSLRTDASNVVLEDGPYSLTIRTGELAVVAVCGLYHEETRVFRPLRMGVRRGLFAVNEQTYDVDLDCDIWLDQELTIKARGVGLSEAGPDVYRHWAYLDLGNEGYFGGLVIHEGTDDVLTASGFAPLEGVLADASYTVRGGSFTGVGYPLNVAWLRGERNVDAPIVLPQLMPALHLVTPDPAAEGGPVLTTGYLEWAPLGAVQPDFWHLTLQDFFGSVWWELVVPGHRTDVTLPEWPEDAAASLFPEGSLFVLARGVDGLSFDMDDFDNSDFHSATWLSYSLNAFTITHGGEGATEPEP